MPLSCRCHNTTLPTTGDCTTQLYMSCSSPWDILCGPDIVVIHNASLPVVPWSPLVLTNDVMPAFGIDYCVVPSDGSDIPFVVSISYNPQMEQHELHGRVVICLWIVTNLLSITMAMDHPHPLTSPPT